MVNLLFGILFLAASAWFSPVNYDISLAGNFGEPRPNHFHAGIDIKTAGVEGKPLFSIGDGYISHVSIGEGGYGNAVYVKHPEGYTSVYCHLKAFTPRVRRMVRRWQYTHKQEKGMITFAPTDLPVTRGMLIAISGNSGSSTAPHLHLEIRDDYTQEYCDPLEFIGQHIKDSMPPMAHGFMVCPKRGSGLFENSYSKQTFSFPSKESERRFTAWGEVGFALWANDYMRQSYNHFGIRKTEMFVNDSLYFTSVVSRIPMWASLHVNSIGDNAHFRRSGVWYMHSYQQPGAKLPFVKATARDGYVNINEEKEYNIKYVLTDYWNNTSTYQLKVIGKKGVFETLPVVNLRNMLPWNKANVFQAAGLQLLLPQRTLENDIELTPVVEPNAGGLSSIYCLYPQSYYLFSPAKLSLQLKKSVKDASKLYVEQVGTYPIYKGGTYQNGWVTCSIKDIGGKYQIAYDDISPTISPVSVGGNQTLRFLVTDSESGLSSVKGYVDNQFVLFENKEKTAEYYCNLAETPLVKKNKQRKLKLKAVDNRGNIKEWTTQIEY
ncbi:MAG: M23 family metallopeptidase [Prevotella sp.]|nr:M23 family metallopeptidase [Prevotella sp.]